MIRLKLYVNKYFRSIQKHIKLFMNIILFNSGYYDYIYSKRKNKGIDLVILTYHSIIKDKVKHAGLEVSETNFVKQIEFLKNHFDIIDIDTGINLLNNNNYKNKLIITFDDGYRNNYSTALPILIKNNIPATIFLTTDPIIKHSLLWGNDLDLAISESNCTNIIIDKLGQIDLSTDEQKIGATKVIKKHLKCLSKPEIEYTIDNIHNQLKIITRDYTDQRYEMLLVDEIIDMSNKNITFGNHTCTHPIVSNISNREFQNELSNSTDNIKEWTGNDIHYFAYPNGLKDDFTEESKNILKTSNYKAAFTLIRGTNNSQNDMYELKRIPVKDCPLPEFASYILKYI